MVYGVDLDKAELTEEELEKIILKTTEVISTEITKETLSVAYYDRGVAYGRKKEHEKAILDFSKAIELSYTYTWAAYYNRGWDYYSIKQFEMALSDFKKADRLNQNNDYIQRNMQATLEKLSGS